MASLSITWLPASVPARRPAPWLALASFATVTQALMVPGLLPGLAEALDVSVAEAGQATTAFAAAAALGALPIARATARIDGRRVVLGGLGLLAVVNLLTALAPGLAALLGLRALAGLLAAAVLPAAPALAVALAGPAGRVQALAAVTFGSTAAFALGLPAASLLAGAVGWQAAFALAALLCAAAAALLAARLPEAPAPRPVVPARLSGLAAPGIPAALLQVALAFASVFATHAFLGPIALATAGTSPAALQAMVALGALAGVPAGAALATRAPGRAPVLVAAALLAAALAQWGLLTGGLHSPLLQAAVVAFASAALFAVSPVLQARLVAASPPEAARLVLAANFVAVQAGQAVGAAAGGLALDAAGLTGAAAAGVVAAAAMLGLAARVR
jgi:DHA1 family inner membrane transport protein